MRIAILAGIAAMTAALSVIGMHTLVAEPTRRAVAPLANPFNLQGDRAMIAAHELAIACYQEGYQKGRMAELIRRIHQLGGSIPDEPQKAFDRQPTEGCRP